jgi:replication factor C large subunit
MEDWTEKYRPKTLDEVVGNEKAITELRNWAKLWLQDKPKYKAVILSGKAGTGKTSSAIALANEMGWTTIELNTSDARNAQKIKNVATSGAVNETFSDDGRFISSKSGGRKLIILDEADNLYETKTASFDSSNDLSDRGGKKAIVETIKITNQPIILIVNDYYSLIKGSGDILKKICKQIKFYEPYSSYVFTLLKKICISEGISADSKVLKNIADRCKGDIRSALNDLQTICLGRKTVDSSFLDVIGYRDREKDIFTAMRDVFKTKDIKSIRESISQLDVDPQMLLLWINENLPKEYLDKNDLIKGYGALSKADVFLGRTFKCQNYCLWSYASDIMNGGVATAKTHSYANTMYSFPTWLRQKKYIKNNIDLREIIIKKISENFHISSNKTKDTLFPYFANMFRNNTYFAIKMKDKYNLTESEVEYILGQNHSYKLKEIIQASKTGVIEPLDKKIDTEEDDSEEKYNEKHQQSIFDF